MLVGFAVVRAQELKILHVDSIKENVLIYLICSLAER